MIWRVLTVAVSLESGQAKRAVTYNTIVPVVRCAIMDSFVSEFQVASWEVQKESQKFGQFRGAAAPTSEGFLLIT